MRIGLVGLGYWGKNIARNLSELGGLNAICDSNINTLSSYKKIYKDVQIYEKIEDLVDS